MRVQYSLKFRDYFAFCLIHQFSMVTNQLLFVGVATLIAVEETMSRGVGQGMFVGVIAFVGMWSLQVLCNVLILHSKKNRAILTDHVVEALDDSFRDTTAFSELRYKWSGIVSVVSRVGFVAIYTAAHAACVIPNRAFANPLERKAFLAHVRSKTAA